MAYIDDVFNESGKIPTDSDFWEQSVDRFVSDDGITPAFGRVIAEQVFKPMDAPDTPFYNRFVGRPLNEGQGWTERAVNKKTARHFNPKATAQDALGYYESSGVEKTFKLNLAGWIPTTLPSDLATAEMMLNNYSVGTLNDALVDSVYEAYHQAMESAIQLKTVSSIANARTVDPTDPVEFFGQLADIASEMMGNDTHFNELSNDENSGIYTSSRNIVAFVNVRYINAYKNAKAGLPNPSELVNNMEVVPMVNALPRPLTTEEFNAGPDPDLTLSWADSPVALDAPAPIAVLMDSRKVEYRPYRGTYRYGLQPNRAGDFVNAHMVFKGSIAVKPWYNAVRINAPSA